MDIFSFLMGLVILYKGEFRIANRHVDRLKSRQIGLLLMLPLAVGVIAALVFLPSAMGTTSISTTGEVMLDSGALENTINTLLVVSVITFVLVGAAIAYIIMNIPPGEAPTRSVPRTRPTSSLWGAQPSQPTAPSDDTLQPEEAEVSSETPQAPPRPQRPRVQHPLEGGGFYQVTRPTARPAAPKAAPGAPKSIMTIAEVAAYLKLSEAQIEALIDDGKLAAVKGAGGYRIARLAADDYRDSLGQT